MKKRIEVLLFSDVLCPWCYVLQPRLDRVVTDFAARGVQIHVLHRHFALIRDEVELARRFGDPQQAKEKLLQGWEKVNRQDDDHRLQPRLLAQKPYGIPTSLPVLTACEAAERVGGEEAHLRYYVRIQEALFHEAQEIGDPRVQTALAVELGLDGEAFRRYLSDPQTRERVEADLQEAKALGIEGVPALVVEQTWLIQGAQSYPVLQDFFDRVVSGKIKP